MLVISGLPGSGGHSVAVDGDGLSRIFGCGSNGRFLARRRVNNELSHLSFVLSSACGGFVPGFRGPIDWTTSCTILRARSRVLAYSCPHWPTPPTTTAAIAMTHMQARSRGCSVPELMNTTAVPAILMVIAVPVFVMRPIATSLAHARTVHITRGQLVSPPWQQGRPARRRRSVSRGDQSSTRRSSNPE